MYSIELHSAERVDTIQTGMLSALSRCPELIMLQHITVDLNLIKIRLNIILVFRHTKKRR